MSLVSDDLAIWLNRELQARNWSGRELARRANVSHNTIALTLKGETTPGPDAAQAIARALKVPTKEVYRRAGLLPEEQPVSEEDELLYYFRQLPDQDRRRVVSVARGFWNDNREARGG